MAKTSDLDELYGVIGQVVIWWGFIETSLNAAIATIVNLPGGKELEPALPMGFKPRVQFIQKAVKTLPILRPLRDEALRSLATVLNIKDRRHELMHSCLSSLTVKNRIWLYTSVSVENGKMQSRDWKLDINKFPSLKRKLEEAVADTLWLASAILAVHPDVGELGPSLREVLRSAPPQKEPARAKFRKASKR